MLGLGYRREMADWEMTAVHADFFEVVPENWVRRDRAPLQALIAGGRPVHLHGVSLNLGGTSELDHTFLRELRELIDDLGAQHYSDHLAASGDAHQLYDLFPIPFTVDEVRRVGDRIRAVQDVLGRRMAVENTTWYANIGPMTEADFHLAYGLYDEAAQMLKTAIAADPDRHELKVKLADIADNADEARLASLDAATAERLRDKYRRALAALGQPATPAAPPIEH